jgi:hypothetical protein
MDGDRTMLDTRVGTSPQGLGGFGRDPGCGYIRKWRGCGKSLTRSTFKHQALNIFQAYAKNLVEQMKEEDPSPERSREMNMFW